MKPQKKFIFDLDGTLYKFAGDSRVSFRDSVFCADLYVRIVRFLANELNITLAEAERAVTEIDMKFDEEMSIGVERTYGIDRYAYYEATWGCDPADYIYQDKLLAEEMGTFAGQAVLLTAAPRIWADKVLQYLEIADVFGENIITGEPDLRKPDPKVFTLAAEKLGVHPAHVTSIGDQNDSDILPANSLGMATIIIGPHIYIVPTTKLTTFTTQ